MKNFKGLIGLACLGLLVFSSCKKEDPVSPLIDPCGIDFATTIHYTAIGDDYADGTIGAADSTVGYFIKESLLNTNHNVTEFNEFYVDGGNAVDLVLEIDAQNPQCVNVMTVIIGTNDLLQNTSPELFRTSFRAVIERCLQITQSSSRVTTALLPNFSVLPGLPESAGTVEEVANRIDEYNLIIEEESEALNINLSDITPLTNAIYSAGFGIESSANGGDDFHPDLLTIKAWANNMALYVAEGIE